MPFYNFDALGDTEFEHLARALASSVLGPALHPFGPGPDGGREAEFRGKVNYPAPEPKGGTWDGYGILQAKYKLPSTRTPDTNWILSQLKTEIRNWTNPKSTRRQKGRIPQYILFVTNVRLTSVFHESGRVRGYMS
ncbi:hypothetical protein SCMU_20440 [Sinomonas cyclohexanicum]|uniref:Uncharacterized protein n=1 Tax=Sinomonas cyclohexanicum TaxID=322009 RepID=A0ABM7PVC0_SINCY|nr:hypothetical protein SCMU_20440 [Corynebacterium cyclohexanicum]